MNTIASTRTLETIHIKGYYRFVDHKNKFLTVGFSTREALFKYKNRIKNDDSTIKLMQARYNQMFKTTLVPKHPLTFYWDYEIVDGEIYLVQERKDDRRSVNWVGRTKKNQIVDIINKENSLEVIYN